MGDHDDHVDAKRARRLAQGLSRAGVHMRLHIYPGEDHFLFLSQLDAVLDDVAEWMNVAPTAPQPGGSQPQGRP